MGDREPTRQSVDRERRRADERIRATAYHICRTAEPKADAYLVDARWIEELRQRLTDWWRAQDRYNAVAIQKHKGGTFEACLREAKEVRRKRDAEHGPSNG